MKSETPSMTGWYVHSCLYGLGQIINDPEWDKDLGVFIGYIEVKWLEIDWKNVTTYTVKGVPVGGEFPSCQILKTSKWQTFIMDKHFGIK